MNWLWKWLGYHVCEEFTQWEKHRKNFSRPCRPGDGNAYVSGQVTVEFTEYWQERRCTICGKIEQQPLSR